MPDFYQTHGAPTPLRFGCGSAALCSSVFPSATSPSRQRRSRRTRRDGSLGDTFPGTSCQATIVQSLRDAAPGLNRPLCIDLMKEAKRDASPTSLCSPIHRYADTAEPTHSFSSTSTSSRTRTIESGSVIHIVFAPRSQRGKSGPFIVEYVNEPAVDRESNE